MSFYAYSPLAGGFLTKTKQQVLDGAGRFDKNTSIGQMYGGMYGKPSYLEALSEWEAIAKEEGCCELLSQQINDLILTGKQRERTWPIDGSSTTLRSSQSMAMPSS